MRIKPLFIFICLLFVSCGSEKDIDKIGNAQLCLDDLGSSATASQVNSCLEKVDGIESEAAYNLRCAGSFLKEGFLNPTKLTNAMTQLDAGSTEDFMGLITFTSSANIDTDTSNSAAAFGYCLKSGGKGTTLIASFGYMAMALYSFMNSKHDASCDDTPGATGYPLSTCGTNFAANAPASAVELVNPTSVDAATITLQSALGSIMISTYNISCVGVGTNSDLCSLLKTAVTSSSNPRSVATRFFMSLGF